MRINIVVSNRNACEVPAMRAIADRFGIESFEYTNINPTIHGSGKVLPSQSRGMLRTRKPYTGCNAGITRAARNVRYSVAPGWCCSRAGNRALTCGFSEPFRMGNPVSAFSSLARRLVRAVRSAAVSALIRSAS